jgi:hypothetical protein
MLHLLSPRRVERAIVGAGVLASASRSFRASPTVTVAAQRWTCTSFHLYALASGLSGRRDGMRLCMYVPAPRLYHICAACVSWPIPKRNDTVTYHQRPVRRQLQPRRRGRRGRRERRDQQPRRAARPECDQPEPGAHERAIDCGAGAAAQEVAEKLRSSHDGSNGVHCYSDPFVPQGKLREESQRGHSAISMRSFTALSMTQ